ncbi:KN motif and ankyrin repeat domain-containing protein 2 [Stigmatopora nigra]
MAQVLHMDAGFPGKLSSPAGPSLHAKDQEAPYSVETPYGYRLDLDFLKYVNDIEKGNTIRKVPVQRRPRYGSLPRGSYGYSGSWWTSTESLCSNASVDSRHSSFSYCAPGYHTTHRPNFSAARVEKTLLDARRKLEEEKEGRRFSNLGSMHSSMVGSNTSISSAHSFNRAHGGGGGGGGTFTPMSSGLSTPVTPTPAHLQNVREQMAAALRKIRDLEEQVKTIPVLQVKISVLQEEKRQLSVQLKSQKFLGHTMGFNRGRSRGELYIDIPEEEASAGSKPEKELLEGSKQDSGCEIEDTVIVAGARPEAKRELRTIGVGPEVEKNSRQVGVGVREVDLGLLPEAEALKNQVLHLEAQLKSMAEELRAVQLPPTSTQGEDGDGPRAEHPVMATTVGWQDLQEGNLQTVVSFAQKSPHREQRTVGIQVYTLEQPTVVEVGTLLRAVSCSTPSASLDGNHRGQSHGSSAESNVGLPVAVCSKQVRDILKSELSTSVPVSKPVVTLGKGGDLMESGRSKEDESAVTYQESHRSVSSPESSLRSIMKRKAEGEPGSPSTKKNLQFIGVNGGYESTSSEDSSSSDEESDSSEYHEAREKLPETAADHQQSTRPLQGEQQRTTGGRETEFATTDKSPQAPATQVLEVPPQTLVNTWASQESTNPPTSTSTDFKSPVTLSPEATEQETDTPASVTPETESTSVSVPTNQIRLELSDSLMSALGELQKALGEPNAFTQQRAREAYTTVLQEWLRVSCHKAADATAVRAYVEAFAAISPQLLEFIINMSDGNGNTALHYTVSHSNFPVVKLLLDTGLCNADKQNKAGYTAIMLTALAAFHSDGDLQAVLQLLRTGDVNAKASQAGQTALMLAVSHGRGDMVRALLSCGAQVNVRDEDGSTALMCACEHGHVDIVRQLLSVPGCDVTITDNDGSTALSIALEASQNDIAVLLYAHLNFAKPPSPVSPKSPLLGSSSSSPAGDPK